MVPGLLRCACILNIEDTMNATAPNDGSVYLAPPDVLVPEPSVQGVAQALAWMEALAERGAGVVLSRWKVRFMPRRFRSTKHATT